MYGWRSCQRGTGECCVLCVETVVWLFVTHTHTHIHAHTHIHTHTHTHTQIKETLEASPVWSAYKDQKHDLFLTDTNISGYLTGPTGVAGYLTAGTSSTSGANPTAPPPLEPPDDMQTGGDDDD